MFSIVLPSEDAVASISGLKPVMCGVTVDAGE